MIVYIGMILWILFLGAVCRKRIVLNSVTRKTEYRATSQQAFLSMAIVVFFIGLRSAGADTHAYISMYQSLPTGISSIAETLKNGESEAGFTIFGILVKTFLSEDFHVYLFLIAAISGFCVVFALKKYSSYFTTSMLLFMLMGDIHVDDKWNSPVSGSFDCFCSCRIDIKAKNDTVYFDDIVFDYHSHIGNHTSSYIFYRRR